MAAHFMKRAELDEESMPEWGKGVGLLSVYVGSPHVSSDEAVKSMDGSIQV